VGCAEHRALADELARRSITLVRNEESLLPLRLSADARVGVIQPRPADLTPADTSSYVTPLLAEAVRRRHSATDELLVDVEDTPREIAAIADWVAGCDAIILGTVSANIIDAQAELARRVLGAGKPTVWVALRTPWDLAVQPRAATYVCSYGIQPPTIDALVGALFGERPFTGRLPVKMTV
jgi:beta-N-acetylhexosaminidase